MREDSRTEQEKAFDKKECDNSRIRRLKYLRKKGIEQTQKYTKMIDNQIQQIRKGTEQL